MAFTEKLLSFCLIFQNKKCCFLLNLSFLKKLTLQQKCYFSTFLQIQKINSKHELMPLSYVLPKNMQDESNIAVNLKIDFNFPVCPTTIQSSLVFITLAR